MLDPKHYGKAQLIDLYRWIREAQVDLKHLKTPLAMDMLRSKTPEMARKEISV